MISEPFAPSLILKLDDGWDITLSHSFKKILNKIYHSSIQVPPRAEGPIHVDMIAFEEV